MALGYTRQKSRQELSRSSRGGKNQSHTVCSWPWSAGDSPAWDNCDFFWQVGSRWCGGGASLSGRTRRHTLARRLPLEPLGYRGRPERAGGGARRERVGKSLAPWCVEGYGELVLSTASLMERTRRYELPMSWRGTLTRLAISSPTGRPPVCRSRQNWTLPRGPCRGISAKS